MEDAADLTTLPAALRSAGRVVGGRYQVRARLGRGSSKDVYLAHDERLDRDVALALLVGGASDRVARERMAREARITGRLGDHPNIVTVYDTMELDGIPCLVLRAMTGGSLADAFAARPGTAEEVARVGADVAAGLAHAHAHGVVHRDVKPDNVWLTGDGRAALGDFGIAYHPGAERLTAEGVAVGTVRYMSPELIRGDPVRPASDLYSLGVTLYELVAGRPPFVAEDPAQILTQHLTATPPPPTLYAPGLPRWLEQAILGLLAKQPERRPASAGAVAEALLAGGAEAAAPARRVVAVLAARGDVTDPEVLHAKLARAAGVIERHDGRPEHYLGDVLVGLFGASRAQGDDSARALRAALALRADDPTLRIGAEMGEVFLGATDGRAVTVGAAIGAASKLADGAGPGEIVLGEDIRRMLAGSVRVEARSGRLLAVEDRVAPAHRSPFIGRRRELEELRHAFRQACDERACRLVTVVGAAGIGKSRLAAALAAEVQPAATVLSCHCLEHGEATTYGPLAELVEGLGTGSRRRVEELLRGDEAAIHGVLAVLERSDSRAQPEETAWAMRRLFERLAAERPLVVVVEDLHWAAPSMLGVLEHVAALSAGAPVLLMCLSRPDLLETHPSWAAPAPNRQLIALEGLPAGEARELAERLGAQAWSERIAERAEGNPLFVEHLVAVGPQAERELPATIQAVLASRIDELDSGERALLRHGAVEGRRFHVGALLALLPDEQQRGIASRLVSLTRKGLIAPERSPLDGEDAFRFTHALVRDAAYAGVPKLVRAQVHEAVAEWLDHRGGAAEIVAFHLEQACLLTTELRAPGDDARRLAEWAVARLQTAAESARARGDPAEASALLERAVALLPAHELLPPLGAALFEAGRTTDAARVLDDAIARAPTSVAEARARIERELVRVEAEPGAGTGSARRAIELAARRLAGSDDAAALGRLASLRAYVAWVEGRAQEADAAWREAADWAVRDGDERELFSIIGWRATAAVLGPTPVGEAIRRCEAFRERVATSPLAVATVVNPLASLHAMRGDFALAEQLLVAANETLDGLGGLGTSVSHHEALVRLLAGQPERAEAVLRAGIETLAEMGDAGLLGTATAMLAQAVYAQRRYEEALELVRDDAVALAVDDIVTQLIVRGVAAKLASRDGRHDEAERLAREAVALAERTDLSSHHADAILDLAEVLHARSSPDEAASAARAALDLLNRKGNEAAAARARALLSDWVEGT